MKATLIFGFILSLFLMGFEKVQSPQEFILKGSIEGEYTEYLILAFSDADDMYSRDTISVNNGQFTFKGTLNNPQEVSLTSNLTDNQYPDNPNYVSFYLEPKQIEIKLVENAFKKADISGSSMQEEFEFVDAMTQPFYDAIKPLMLKRNQLSDKRKQEVDTVAIDGEINKVQNEWEHNLQEIRNVQLNYATDNPNSYLGANFVKYYSKVMSKDSLRVYYDNFDQEIVLSSYGKSIKEVLDFHLVVTGDIAPNFKTIDANGNELNLEQFRGKYVLLDFWAGWCVPCIKKHPELKKLYKKYHDQGFEIIGVSVDNDETSWKESIAKENVEWHNIFVGTTNFWKKNSIYKIYGIQPIPAYILIDKEGFVVDRYLNADNQYKDIDVLENKLKEIFK